MQIGAGLATFLTKAGASLGPFKTDPCVGGGKWRRAPPPRAGVRPLVSVIIRGRVIMLIRVRVIIAIANIVVVIIIIVIAAVIVSIALSLVSV